MNAERLKKIKLDCSEWQVIDITKFPIIIGRFPLEEDARDFMELMKKKYTKDEYQILYCEDYDDEY